MNDIIVPPCPHDPEFPTVTYVHAAYQKTDVGRFRHLVKIVLCGECGELMEHSKETTTT